MTNKEHVLEYEGEFSISGGGIQTMPNGRDVHFALNPRMGCRGVNVAVGLHKPGKEFAPHKYSISEEILIIHNSKGECCLYNKWIPVEIGDIVFAPPDTLHGTRNPVEGTGDFVALGIAALPQLDPYLRAGYDILGDNSGEYMEKVQRGNWRKERCPLVHIVKC